MKLNFKAFGEGDPIVILHGLLGSLDNWQSIAKKLAGTNRVYIVDQRNHGKSPHEAGLSYDLMAKDLTEFYDDHNIESSTIIGHSMGGKTAMNFATENPDKVQKLIVVDIGVKYYPPHHQDVLDALNAVDFNIHKERKDVEVVISQHISEIGIVQWLMKNLGRGDQNELVWKCNLKEINKEIENIGEALNPHAYFSGETLFVKGELSNYILEEDYDAIENHFPLWQIKTIENSGHWLHAEQPDVFIEIVKDFLT